MGVFAWLRRKSKRTDGTAAEELPSAAPTADTAIDGDSGTAEAAAADATTASETSEVREAPDVPGVFDGNGSAGTEGEGTDTPDGVDIPKQQTADEAADNEAGEGARK